MVLDQILNDYQMYDMTESEIFKIFWVAVENGHSSLIFWPINPKSFAMEAEDQIYVIHGYFWTGI